jgi:tetratricopeptide (TPR) repeat protein
MSYQLAVSPFFSIACSDLSCLPPGCCAQGRRTEPSLAERIDRMHRRSRRGAKHLWRHTIVSIIVFTLLGCFVPVAAENIVLKDGKTITGRIVEETDSYVKISTTLAILTVTRDRIAKIERDKTISREEQEGDRALRENRLEDAFRLYTAAVQTKTNAEEVNKKLQEVTRRIEERDAKKYGEIFDKIDALIAEKKFDSAGEMLNALGKETALGPSVKKRIHNRTAQIFFAQAQESLNRIDYTKAEAELREAIREDSDFYQARLLYAKLLDKNPAREAEALEQYLAGLKTAGNQIPPEEQCGYQLAIATIYYDRADYSQALTHLKNIQEMNPARFAACKNLMVNVYTKLSEIEIAKDFEKGTGYLKEALKIDPTDENVRMTLAQHYMKRGLWKEAIEQLAELTRRNPYLKEVHYNMALCYERMNMYEEARKEYQAELKGNPQHYNALTALGEQLLQGGDYRGALQYFTQAVETSPERYRAYLGLGQVHAKLGHYIDAKENLQKVLDIEPKHREAIFLLGTILNEEKDYAKAEEFFDTVIASIRESRSEESGPNARDRQMLVEALLRRGEIEFSLDRPRTALGDFQEALKYEPQSAEAYYDMGRVHQKLAIYTEAERLYKQALELNPKDPRYHLSLGIIYQNNLKDLKKAVEHYRQYILLGGPDIVTVNKWIEECGGEPIYPKLKQ